MFINYPEVLDYLYQSAPMFQRIGASAYKADLGNTIRLCAAANNPQSKFKSIHVAGTNGKGSTSHMLSSIFQESGYKTGLYTSPHLKEFTERIRVDGQEVSKQFVVDFVNRMRLAIDEIEPSFFEVTVVMAFDYFVQQKVDVAVIEVGLGGRLDSTNIVMPELSIITNIGWDHMDLLGHSLEKIAIEKAGIIKNSVPVVVSERQAEIQQVFIDSAAKHNSQLHFASDDYVVQWKEEDETPRLQAWKRGDIFFTDVLLPLQGFYQEKNVAGVLKSVDELNGIGFEINHSSLLKGLVNVVSNTALKGRWQKLGDHPLMVCDTGHNVDGMLELMRQIKAQKFDTLYMVLGMVKDKDVQKVLGLLPTDARYYFCQASIPRAMDAEMLAAQALQFGLHGIVVKDVNAAIRRARREANGNDFIFIGGSTFVVAEIENL